MAKSRAFYERYQAGEHMPVWRELIGLGEKVREEPLRSDAFQVCEEVVRRAQGNLRTLHARLLDLDYEFAEPDAALVDAGADAGQRIEAVERELGALPLIARVWYGTLASVNFCQAEQQLVYRQSIQSPLGPDIFGLGSHPVLNFQSLDCCWQQLQEMAAEHEEHVRELRESGWQEPPDEFQLGQFLPLGGWASNCNPKGFPLPAYGVDAVIYNDGGGDTYFVDELRSAFRWGGFPFWQWCLKKANFYSPCEYRPNFEKLLPLLKEGLLEL